jgi:hypothetical protein
MDEATTGSRERLLGAMDGSGGGLVPLSFMIFRALRDRCADELDFAAKQAELGLDVRVQIEDLPIRFAPEVEVEEWTERESSASEVLLHRVYHTPAGALTASVRKSDDWPYGDSLPLFDDYVTPRSTKYLVTGEEDLPALAYLLAPPTDTDIQEFLDASAERKRFAANGGYLLQAGWKSGRDIASEDVKLVGQNAGLQGIDTLMWLCGGTEPLIWGFEKPGLLTGIIDLVAEWNRKRLALHLETGPDLVVRRAWYEGTDFWSPDFYRRFILPGLKREVEMAHEADARFGYILTSGLVPLAAEIIESGVDVIIGIDPAQAKGGTLDDVAAAFGGKVCLWGGVSGPMTIESGSRQDVIRAVETAMEILAPTGRFILSPVDNVRENTPRAWENLRTLIDLWKERFR